MDAIFGLILASLFPLVFLRIIYKTDFYQIGQFHLIVRSLVWGIFAYLVAALTNKLLEISGMVNPKTVEQLTAPVLEEVLKGLVLFYLIRRAKIAFSVDGALYGFAAGIGFAIAENSEYIFYKQAIAVEVALQRIFSANLVHASSTALLGVALGVFYLERTRARWLVLASGLLLAIGQHNFYNTISGASLASAFVIGILGFVIVYLVMLYGKKQAQIWIRQKLGMDDRVTPGEVAMVDRLDSKQDIFLPVVERFGIEKASQVEKLLYLQARLGIKRKFLDSLQKNDPVRNAMEKELREMRSEMRVSQRAVGTYVMLFVRGLYTEELVSVWEQMRAKIRERSAGNSVHKGGGLWSSLEERLKAPSESERRE